MWNSQRSMLLAWLMVGTVFCQAKNDTQHRLGLPLDPNDEPKVTPTKVPSRKSGPLSLKAVTDVFVTFAANNWREPDASYPPQTKATCKGEVCLVLKTYRTIQIAAIRYWIVQEAFKLNFRDHTNEDDVYWEMDAWEFRQYSGEKERFASVAWRENDQFVGGGSGNNATLSVDDDVANTTTTLETHQLVSRDDDDYTPEIYGVSYAPRAPGPGLRSLIGLLLDILTRHVWIYLSSITLRDVGIQTGDRHYFAKKWINGMVMEIRVETLRVAPFMRPDEGVEISYNIMDKLLRLLVPEMTNDKRRLRADFGLRRGQFSWGIARLQTYPHTLSSLNLGASNASRGVFLDGVVDLSNDTSTGWEASGFFGASNETDGNLVEI